MANEEVQLGFPGYKVEEEPKKKRWEEEEDPAVEVHRKKLEATEAKQVRAEGRKEAREAKAQAKAEEKARLQSERAVTAGERRAAKAEAKAEKAEDTRQRRASEKVVAADIAARAKEDREAAEREGMLGAMSGRERKAYLKAEQRLPLEEIKAQERKVKGTAQKKGVGKGKIIAAAAGGFVVGRGVRFGGKVTKEVVGRAPALARGATPRGITTKGYLPGPETREALTPQFGALREATTIPLGGLRQMMIPSKQIYANNVEEGVYTDMVQHGNGASRTEVLERGEAGGIGRARLGKALMNLRRIGAIRIAPEYSGVRDPYYEVVPEE